MGGFLIFELDYGCPLGPELIVLDLRREDRSLADMSLQESDQFFPTCFIRNVAHEGLHFLHPSPGKRLSESLWRLQLMKGPNCFRQLCSIRNLASWHVCSVLSHTNRSLNAKMRNLVFPERRVRPSSPETDPPLSKCLELHLYRSIHNFFPTLNQQDHVCSKSIETKNYESCTYPL